MQLNDYQTIALSTLTDGHEFGDLSPQLIDQVFGLTGEAGEVAEKFKKLIRDKQGKISEDDKKDIMKELGDVLWYVTTVSHLIGSSLEDVAKMNNEKLLSRKARDQIAGSGDNR